MNKISSTCDKVIEFSFYLLFFLVPLILTPWNYELFEFNKMMLTYFFTTLIIAAWLVKMLIQRTILYKRTFLDIPLILFLGSQIISTIYSIDRHTSLWGYYSRFNGGLFSTIAYILLYWAYVSNLDREKTLQIIRYTLFTTILIALYGIAEHFGIDAEFWRQLVQERVFSTLGQPNWLAAWLVALIPLTWALIFGKEKLFKKKLLPFVGYGLLTIFYLCLLYTKSRSGLFGLAVAYATFWGLVGLINLKRFKKLVRSFIIINLIFIIITAIVGTPWTPQVGQLINQFRPQSTPEPEATVSAEAEPIPLISESGDIRKIVWQGAIEIWKDYPIFGTGVETFGYSYYWHRPRAHNDVSEWDLLYNKAHNEYLTILANTGLVGLITYLGLIGIFIAWVLRQIIAKKSALLIALLAGYISILVTNFFGFSVVPVNLLFFLIPAMATILVEKEKEEKVKAMAIETKQKIAIVIILILGLSTIIYLAKFWYADTRFAVAEKLNDAAWYERAYHELQTAIGLHPSEPYYHSEMSLALAGLAKLADEAEDASLSAQLAELAIDESDKALKISPYHLNFWKKRAKMFISLVELDSQYQQGALDALLQAAELAPTDAKVFYNLGLLYSQIEQMETAIKTMEHAVELKPNYAQARYALALFYEDQGKIKEAQEELEYILEKINPADTRAKNKLEGL